MPGIAKGRRGGRDGKKVTPVPDPDINAALEYLPPLAQGMVMVPQPRGYRRLRNHSQSPDFGFRDRNRLTRVARQLILFS